MKTFPKDPDATLDFGVDWAARGWLQPGETIVTSEWSVSGPDNELQSSSPGHDETTTLVWLSGGTLDAKYRVTNRITTSAGRTDDRSFFVRIRER